MNGNLIAFTALMAIFVIAFLVMLYFQYVDGYVRKWRYEKEMDISSATDGQPTVTWVLEAKFKELTQDEILDIWYAMEDDSNNWTRYVEFARAILRKAQEK